MALCAALRHAASGKQDLRQQRFPTPPSRSGKYPVSEIRSGDSLPIFASSRGKTSRRQKTLRKLPRIGQPPTGRSPALPPGRTRDGKTSLPDGSKTGTRPPLGRAALGMKAPRRKPARRRDVPRRSTAYAFFPACGRGFPGIRPSDELVDDNRPRRALPDHEGKHAAACPPLPKRPESRTFP